LVLDIQLKIVVLPVLVMPMMPHLRAIKLNFRNKLFTKI